MQLIKFKFVLLLIILITPLKSTCQKVKISGYIIDKESGEVLIGATIFNKSENKGCISNNYGYYSFYSEINSNIEIIYAFVGYEPAFRNFSANNDSLLNIYLLSKKTNLGDLTVFGNKRLSIENKSEIGKINLDVNLVHDLPSLTGESDILKALQYMPGIQFGSEGNNELIVRGGTPDQNLFLYDNVPLYNVSHLGGLFSVFDPKIIKSIYMYKGGFPARYGGRLSSISDIRTKDGDLFSYKSEISISTLISKVFIEGPIIKGKSSFVLSTRVSNLGLYSKLYRALSQQLTEQKYTFRDINFKSIYNLTSEDKIFFSFYNGRDVYSIRENNEVQESSNNSSNQIAETSWGNTAISLKWTHVFTNRAFNTVTIAHTKYNYENLIESIWESESNDQLIVDQYDVNSRISDIIAICDFENIFENSQLKLGGSIGRHSYNPTTFHFSNHYSNNLNDTINYEINSRPIIQSFSVFGYAEWSRKFLEKADVNLGIRSGMNLSTTIYPSVEPRLSFTYHFLKSAQMKISYSHMQQYIHLLTSTNTGLPTDFWVPSTSKIKPETSNQISFGLTNTTEQLHEFTLEFYGKWMNNLIEYKEGILIFDNSKDWEDKIEINGTGRTNGIELLYRKNKGKIRGWAGYTLATSNRRFSGINNGEEFPFKYDQRHNISIVGIIDLKKDISCSFTWKYHSGNRLTMPIGSYKLENFDYSGSDENEGIIFNTIHIYSKRNAYQMPAYHRLDIGINFRKQKRHGVRKFALSVYNVYNRKNAFYLFFRETANNEIKLYQQSLFPFLINLGYTFNFGLDRPINLD